jgi:hypothetical protein
MFFHGKLWADGKALVCGSFNVNVASLLIKVLELLAGTVVTISTGQSITIAQELTSMSSLNVPVCAYTHTSKLDGDWIVDSAEKRLGRRSALTKI